MNENSLDPIPAAVAVGDDVLYQTLKDEIVVLNMKNQQYYGLDDVASEMWRLLLEEKSVQSAAEKLKLVYAADQQVLADDLRNFVRKLLDAGLLKAA